MNKKVIAPIIITFLLILYFTPFLLGAMNLSNKLWGIKVTGVLIFIGVIGLSIYVCVERIREIRSGEENDLSKY